MDGGLGMRERSCREEEACVEQLGWIGVGSGVGWRVLVVELAARW